MIDVQMETAVYHEQSVNIVFQCPPENDFVNYQLGEFSVEGVVLRLFSFKMVLWSVV